MAVETPPVWIPKDRRLFELYEAAGEAIAAQTRALELKREGVLRYLADDSDCPPMMRLAALMEEVGEVARAMHDGTGNLHAELVQVAGVALAWASAVDP